MRTIQLSDMRLGMLMEVEGIDDMFVTEEAMNKIKEICYIGTIFNTEEELRGIRAGIVKDFHQKKEDAFNNQKPELYWKLQAVMSATVATIDDILFRMGCEV